MGAGEAKKCGPSRSWLWDPARQRASQATSGASALFPQSFRAPNAQLGPGDPVAALSNACWAALVSAGRAELGPVAIDGWRLTCRSGVTPIEGGSAGLAVEITACAALEPDGGGPDDRLARAAHDLRAPLTSILGFAEFIAASGAAMPEETRRGYLSDIVSAGRFAARMVDDLLSYSTAAEVAAHHAERVDLAGVATNAARMLTLEAEARDVTVTLRAEAKAPAIRAAEDQMLRAAVNLLGNAVAHAGREVTLLLEESANAVTLSIIDDGPGLSVEDLTLALTPFGRPARGADADSKGAGLGLPIAQRFVEANGGRLEIETAPGAGFAARMIFPADGEDSGGAG